MFSLKYEDKKYPSFICAADWGGAEWSRTIGLTDGLFCFEYTPSLEGLDELAFRSLLDRFGISEWKNEMPVETKTVNRVEAYSFWLPPFLGKKVVINDVGNVTILRMSPAQLIAKRREKEKLHNLPRLEVTTDNLDMDFRKGKGKVSHYAEEYD